MAFQTQVYLQPAPGIEGDFSSNNPRGVILFGGTSPGLIAGTGGVTVGRFAVARQATGLVTNNGMGVVGTADSVGFVQKDQPALITGYLAQYGMTVPAGYPVTVFRSGDFWARFAGGATIGQKVYASYADGSCVSAAASTPATNAGITANTTSGSATLTVTANSGDPIVVGQPVSGTGIAAGAVISALGTGTGGAGTYTMSANATATGTGVTVTATTTYETAWYVDSTAAAGELAKISIRR